MNKQSGTTLSGLINFLILVVGVGYVLTRIGPTFYEYWVVDRLLDDIVKLPEIQTSDDETIRSHFERQLQINNARAVTRADLLIERYSGSVHLSVPLSDKKSFIGPVSLGVDLVAEASR